MLTCQCSDATNLFIDEFVAAIPTLILGVVSLVFGSYIFQIRKDAKYGFYVNLYVYVKRFKFYLENSEFEGITDYLCSGKIRTDILKTAITDSNKDVILPTFTSLCKEFITFISHADNNIPPFSIKTFYKRKKLQKEWYNNLITITEFVQKCLLLDYKMKSYTSSEEANCYIEDLAAFKTSLDEISEKIKQQLALT